MHLKPGFVLQFLGFFVQDLLEKAVKLYVFFISSYALLQLIKTDQD